MPPADSPTDDYQFPERTDLLAALDQAFIEYLEVNDTRAVVMFKNGILLVDVTQGTLTTASAFEVTLLEPPGAAATQEGEESTEPFLDTFLQAVERNVTPAA